MKNRYIFSLITGIILCFFIFSSFSKAEGTCPVPLADVSSQGVLIYNTGDSSSDIKLYTSDLINLKNEIEALGIYTDEELTDVNLHIDEIIADVSSGKRNIAEELNTHGADIDISNEKVPSWSELKGGVEPVYTNGYNTGYSAGHTDGYDEGYITGEHDGYLDGYEAGNTDGDTAGYTRGYNKGKEDGHEEGYEEGHNDGYNEGYDKGHDDGYDEGYDKGYDEGYTKGKEDGVTIHTATYIATVRNSKIDLGQKHTYRYIDTTGVPNSNDGTYKPTTRSDSIDMGATNTYRYVNTSSVPNTNSGTYTYPANSTGGTIDLGETNTYRYVNATNVYNKGKADANKGYGVTTLGSFSQGAPYDASGSLPRSASYTVNVKSSLPSVYNKLSSSNFRFIVSTVYAFGDNENANEATVACSPACSYNASTGILTVTGLCNCNYSGDDVSVCVTSGYVLCYYPL